jgi:hypothetical protein
MAALGSALALPRPAPAEDLDPAPRRIDRTPSFLPTGLACVCRNEKASEQ